MFVVFEGMDGTGKKTVSNRLAKRLRSAGRSAAHLREDGEFASPLVTRLREFGKDPRNLALEPLRERLLYLARETQILAELTRPALAGSGVVSDIHRNKIRRRPGARDAGRRRQLVRSRHPIEGSQMKTALLAAALTVAAARPARGQTEPPAPQPPASPPPESSITDTSPPPATPPSPPPPPRRDYQLEFGARLFVRDTLTRVDIGDDSVWVHDRDIDQARVFATYNRKKLRLALEVELAGRAELKDTYIRLRPVSSLRVQAGRFKVPMSSIGLESKWSLPSVERGILSEIAQEDRDLPFAGHRADGVAVELRPHLALSPRFTVAAFQNPLATGAMPLDPTEHFTQDLYARAEIEPVADLHAAVAFGLIGYTAQLGDLGTFEHVPLGSVELFADTAWVRVWAEAFAGKSFYYQPDGSTSGAFTAARALIAARTRRPFAAVWRLEPYLSASLFDPTGDVSGDRVSEVAGGLNAAFSKHWRLQVETAQRITEGVGAPVADSTVVRVQLGAAFAETLE